MPFRLEAFLIKAALFIIVSIFVGIWLVSVGLDFWLGFPATGFALFLLHQFLNE